MVNCLDRNYIPLDPKLYGWCWNDEQNQWEPVWYEGDALPKFGEMNSVLDEDDEVVDEVNADYLSGSDVDSDVNISEDDTREDSDEDWAQNTIFM